VPGAVERDGIGGDRYEAGLHRRSDR
jgi:hypothetical protein